MLVEAVMRVLLVQHLHLCVALDLGEDRGGADGGDASIALDDGSHRAGQIGRLVAIDENVVGANRQLFHRLFHRQPRGLQDVEAVDVCRADADYRPGGGVLLDFFGQHFAAAGAEFLGVGQPQDGMAGIEDDSGGDHVADQRPAPGFIDTGQQAADGGNLILHCYGSSGRIPDHSLTPISQKEYKNMSKSKTVFIVAGEASGDLHAANLCRELLAMDDSIRLQGMGGRKMREAGVEVLFDATELAVVGLVEVLFKYRMIKGVLNQIKAHLRQSPPALLILVDYQEFNQRLAAYAKSLGIKVLFYIGPQVWAWRPKRVYKMARIVDQMAVIFPFEVELYKKARVPVEFTGHPLVDENIPDKTTAQARAALSLEEQTTVGLFPGSRSGEIERLLPIMLATARLLREKRPELQFVLPLASSIQPQDLARYGKALSALEVRVVENNTHDVIQACDSIIVASGTATLEIGLMGTPMVITHKLAALSYFILSRLVSISHIGLVNIVPGKEIVREFIQHAATPENLTGETLRILEDKNYNQTMRDELSKLRALLGTGGGSKNVARLAYSMLEKNNN